MNQNKIVLEEIAKGLDMGIQSIESVKGHIDSPKMKETVQRQEMDYQNSINKANVLSRTLEEHQHTSSAIETAFLKSMIKMKTMMNDSDEHIAKMLIQGSNMLIIDLNKIKNDYVNHSDVSTYIEDLLAAEQKHIDALKPFL